tara:strand:- start:185 stop:406 length:222 start_codon:yes stop_codon:yes gene_type:complete
MISRSSASQQIMKPPTKRKSPLGSGKRFKQLVGKLKKNPKNKTPEKLAAFIGRKKYGPQKFAKMAATGRRRKS